MSAISSPFHQNFNQTNVKKGLTDPQRKLSKSQLQLFGSEEKLSTQKKPNVQGVLAGMSKAEAKDMEAEDIENNRQKVEFHLQLPPKSPDGKPLEEALKKIRPKFYESLGTKIPEVFFIGAVATVVNKIFSEAWENGLRDRFFAPKPWNHKWNKDLGQKIAPEMVKGATFAAILGPLTFLGKVFQNILHTHVSQAYIPEAK